MREAVFGRETIVFVWRPHDRKILVLHRRPSHGGFWHPVSGAVEAGERSEAAALRELMEEIRLDAEETLPTALRCAYRYERSVTTAGLDEPREVTIEVQCYLVRAAPGFSPTLDREHDQFRWCEPKEAIGLLHWPNVRAALRKLLSLSPVGAAAGNA